MKRSIQINRAQFIGTALTLAAAIALLATAGAWLEAGLSDESLGDRAGLLVTVASSFIGMAALLVGVTVASTIATGLRERRRQFALLTAVGASAQQLHQIVLGETLLLFTAAAPVGAAAAAALTSWSTAPLASAAIIPADYHHDVGIRSTVSAIAVVLVVAVIAAWAASYRTHRLNTADAIRESGRESTNWSGGRLATAVTLAGLGAAAALLPLWIPGLTGLTAATSSVFFFIAALAAAGPILAAAGANALGRLVPTGSWLRLPLANMRGFSRRLTAVVIPLALVAVLGPVQLSSDAIVTTATNDQLTAGIRAELIGSSDEADRIGSVPGVRRLAVLETGSGYVIDDPDEWLTVWEPATISTITGADAASLIDPGVTAGSLEALRGKDTIAVSRDSLFLSEHGLGSQIRMRMGGEETDRTIVAVYDRGFAFGDYIVANSIDDIPATGALLVETDRDPALVTADANERGISLSDTAEYAARMSAEGDATLSQVMLLALLLFALLAGLNTLAAQVRSRRQELQLLYRVGGTGPSLVGIIVAEAVIVAIVAVLIGTAIAVPAVAGAGFALLTSWPSLPWAALAAIPAVVVLTAVATAAAGGLIATRRRKLASAAP